MVYFETTKLFLENLCSRLYKVFPFPTRLRHEQIVAVTEVDSEPVVVFGLATVQANPQIFEDGDDELEITRVHF